MKKDSKMTPFEETTMSILNAIYKRLEKIEEDIAFLKESELGYRMEMGDEDEEFSWNSGSIDKVLCDILGDETVINFKKDEKDKSSNVENIIEFPKT